MGEATKAIFVNHAQRQGVDDIYDKPLLVEAAEVYAKREKMRVHTMLIAAFLAGGFSGAIVFKYLGFVSSVPLAIILGAIALAPVWATRRL